MVDSAKLYIVESLKSRMFVHLMCVLVLGPFVESENTPTFKHRVYNIFYSRQEWKSVSDLTKVV